MEMKQHARETVIIHSSINEARSAVASASIRNCESIFISHQAISASSIAALVARVRWRRYHRWQIGGRGLLEALHAAVSASAALPCIAPKLQSKRRKHLWQWPLIETTYNGASKTASSHSCTSSHKSPSNVAAPLNGMFCAFVFLHCRR